MSLSVFFRKNCHSDVFYCWLDHFSEILFGLARVLSLSHPWPQRSIVWFHQRNIVHPVWKDHLRYCSHLIYPPTLIVYIWLSERRFIKSGKLMARQASAKSQEEKYGVRRLFKEYCKSSRGSGKHWHCSGKRHCHICSSTCSKNIARARAPAVARSIATSVLLPDASCTCH